MRQLCTHSSAKSLSLATPSVQSHPNIVELQGICWDVVSDHSGKEKIWPVLVLEKSQYSDLYRFATLPIGRGLDNEERLKLCIDVGAALVDLHFNCIIHGDIKPENVLIFKESTSRFTAKVTDFGYSTRFAGEDDWIPVPISRPWCAPEHNSDTFKPAQAQRMDVFSFGMLCMWLLFEKYLSGGVPFPPEATWAEEYFNGKEGKPLSESLLEGLKQEDRLKALVEQLLAAEESLPSEKKRELKSFFTATLASDPEVRADLKHSFNLLAPNISRPRMLELEKGSFHVKDCSFDIFFLFTPLYDCDYRVRREIARCLESRAYPVDNVTYMVDYSTQDHGFQLAFCYELGFGVPRDEEMWMRVLVGCRTWQEETTEGIMNIIRDNLRRGREARDTERGTTYERMQTLGYIIPMDLPHAYQKDNKLEEAVEVITREIRDIQYQAEKDTVMWLLHTERLALLYEAQGRWKESEQLLLETLELKKQFLGEDHGSTMITMNYMGTLLCRQERWIEAEVLQVRIVERMKRVHGVEDIRTLVSMGQLASTYSELSRWEEAEELLMLYIPTSKRILGKEHRYTLAGLFGLAMIKSGQGRFDEAEKLQVQVLEMRRNVLGEEHPETINSMATLAYMLLEVGRKDESISLMRECVRLQERVLGTQHPDTQSVTGTLDALQKGTNLSKS